MANKKIAGVIPSKLRKFMEMDNIATGLSKDELAKIGKDVVEDLDKDESSRQKWYAQYEKALKLVRQEIEAKNTPWPGASNVKYPLMLNACIQFNARTNPQIVKNEKAVTVTIALETPSEAQQARADRIADHMSYQLLEEIPNWRSDTDKLLMALPVHGVVFRKTYFEPIEKRPQVDLCMPRDIVINNNAESLEKAPRVTHKIHASDNTLISRMRSDVYLTYSMDELKGAEIKEENVMPENYDRSFQSDMDYTGLQTLFEQHTYLDLDDDGYSEPYIVTVHRDTQKVFRIVARYDEDSFIFEDEKKEFIKIKPNQYFTAYHFIPAPDGSFYSLGYGHILYPMNESINSITNQLIDAGTLANRGGGFIRRGFRERKRPIRFVMGEFIDVNLAPEQSFQDSIYPMPAKEGSPTLFNLLSLLIKSGEEISNTSDILQGQAPAPNTPATTVMAMVEQGTKVYSSMLLRLHQSLKKEFEKLYEINKKYLPQYEDYKLATKSGEIKLADYQDPNFAILPVADPAMASDTHRLARAQALMQFAENPIWQAARSDPYAYEIARRFLEAVHIQNIDEILPKPPSPEEQAEKPPSPEMQLAAANLQKIHTDMQKSQAETHKLMMEANGVLMDKELQAIGLNLQEEKQQANAAFMGSQSVAAKIDSVVKMAEVDANMDQQQVEMAAAQVQQLTPAAEQPDVQLENRITAMENALQGLLGITAPEGYSQSSAQAAQSPVSASGMPPAEGQEAAPVAPQEGVETPPSEEGASAT